MAEINTAHWMAAHRHKEIIQILTKIKRKFEIIVAVWQSERSFEAKFRTQIPRYNDDFNELCDEWVDIFSEITDTVWVKKISNTGPKIRFRKQYQCWTQGGEVKKELLFDPTRCKGTLDIKVLSDNFSAKRTHKHLKLGLNIIVKINFNHLHPVDTTQVNSFFVHKCEPQVDIPKRIIEPNKKLPELIAAMVQNGPAVSIKNAEKAKKILSRLGHDTSNQSLLNEDNVLWSTKQSTAARHQEVLSIDNIAQQNSISESAEFQILQSVKIDDQPTSQKCAQYIINTNSSNSEIGEQFLMFQPVLFDMPQFISLTTQSLSPQFIQIQPSIQNNVLSKDNSVLQNSSII